MYYDFTYILVILGAVICAIASWNVNNTYKKFSEINNKKNLKAQDVAKFILENAGINDVKIEHVSGSLTDHYSPNEKVLRLSDSVYGSTSVAALGVAAHECGHAIQHKQKYMPLNLRSFSVPLANIGSTLSWPIIVLGLVLNYLKLAQVGIILFIFVVLFQLITLPVEFNASRRAMDILEENDILVDDELNYTGKVLKAAALTYVASLFSTILQLFRLILIVSGNKKNDRDR